MTFDIGQALGRARAHWQAGQADQAEMACQQVLAVWPGQSDAMHLLGIMAHAYGNLDLAIAHLRQACQAPRAPAVYFSDLAEMCRQRGLMADGEQAARRAVAMAPNQAGAWNNLGIILQETGRLDESRLCLQRVLALQPDNAQAHNNLGNTCKRLGLLDQAEQYWMQALALQPNYAEPYSNLANLLNDRGDYDKAAEYGRRAIELNPQLADAYINLSGIETSRQRHGDALRWLNALLSFAPMHAGGLAAQALVLKQLDELPAALDAAQLAVSAAPENPETHNALGQVLQALGRFEPALAAYDRAATLPGTARETALLNRAALFIEFGRTAEARAALDAVREAFPDSARALFNQADLRRFTADDPAIGKMQAMLAPGGAQSPSDRMLLHFALGKACLDLGESERAFRHLNEGNRMKRATFAYDPEATALWMASIPQVFTPALLEAKAGQGAASAVPVFVLGMPRSGTTLVEQVLASHPDIHGAGEMRHVQGLVDSLGSFPDSAAGLTPEQLAAMGAAYLARVAPLAQGRRHVVDKMPSNFLYAGLIRLILPDARIIHCRRDPVDTCLSCYTKLFTSEQAFSYDLAELGGFHSSYQALMAHWRAVLPASHFLEVDYEAVVADLEAEARRILAFLELPWDDACLRFHETERPVRTASVNQVRQPVYRSSAGRWRAHAAQLGPLLAALGAATA
ncbi:MAG TPA: sulfotransferase [Acetobacteraceae bacterium]|nr:sulfotransferase [Acetobacteraceae bacterium]